MKKRVVIKVGSSMISDDHGISFSRIKKLVSMIVELRRLYIDVILVSSGAVAVGHNYLKISKLKLENKQALASIGQHKLMNIYSKKFKKHDIITSQVLLTWEDFRNDDSIKNIQNTINVLLENGVVPIINENDVVGVEELKIGDNDQLAAFVTNHINAEYLAIISDVDGYYDGDPELDSSKIQRHVHKISKAELNSKQTPNNKFATGGIVTKLKAADYLMKNGKKMFLDSWNNLENIQEFIKAGIYYKTGTVFSSKDSEEYVLNKILKKVEKKNIQVDSYFVTDASRPNTMFVSTKEFRKKCDLEEYDKAIKLENKVYDYVENIVKDNKYIDMVSML